MHPQIHDMMSLFVGYDKAHGTYQITGEMQGRKQLGKALTIKEDVTLELWHDHLVGRKGLGIIPINEKSMVKFAAIDIDQYPINVTEINERIVKDRLPLVPCTTKSGGLHLYLFLSEWTPAKDVQEKLALFAGYLGYGDSEIFPKQSKINVERGDMGQWINMPYYLGDRGNRYGISREGHKLPMDRFVVLAMERRVTSEQLLKFQLPVEEILRGGPPCLNCLGKSGFPPGTRNNGLYNIGVYAKKSHPDNWQAIVEEMNMKLMDPPLGSTEVLGVIKSLGKKDWQYSCDQPPIKQFCNKQLCRTKEFGIGGPRGGFPLFGTLTKFCSEPPLWFLEVEGGGRLELTTDELQNPTMFQRRCMSQLSIMPPVMKRDNWIEVVQRLLSDVSMIEVPEEAAPSGMMAQYLEDFCTSRASGHSKDELLLGKPWTDNGRHYFRLRDFLQFLDRHKFKETSNWVAVHLKDMGGKKEFFNIRGKGITCYSIPEFKNRQEESFPTPEMGKPTPY